MGYRNYGPSNGFIVDAASSDADFATITTAIAAAPANTTIFLKPGTYTENFTLASGKNLAAWDCDAFTPNVTISGTITVTSATTVSISGIRLQTNSAAFLAVTGSAASIVNLNNCYLNSLNNTGITFSTSSGSAQLNILYCQGDIGTTGIANFSHSSAGLLQIQHCLLGNSGASTTASTASAGQLNINFSKIGAPITTSGTNLITANSTYIDSSPTNTLALTIGGSGSPNKTDFCYLSSGTASAVSIGSNLVMTNCEVNSSNTNAITGGGSVTVGQIDFSNTSSLINTTTQVIEKRSAIQTSGIGIGASPGVTAGLTFDGTSYLTIFSQGTFTPTMQGSSTAGTFAYSSQLGRYQKVGRLVTVSIEVSWTTIGTAAGAPQCNNLPFTVINNSSAGACPSLCSGGGGAILTTAASAVPFFQPNANAATGNINYYLGATGANNAGVITASNGFSTQLVYETV